MSQAVCAPDTIRCNVHVGCAPDTICCSAAVHAHGPRALGNRARVAAIEHMWLQVETSRQQLLHFQRLLKSAKEINEAHMLAAHQVRVVCVHVCICVRLRRGTDICLTSQMQNIRQSSWCSPSNHEQSRKEGLLLVSTESLQSCCMHRWRLVCVCASMCARV